MGALGQGFRVSGRAFGFRATISRSNPDGILAQRHAAGILAVHGVSVIAHHVTQDRSGFFSSLIAGCRTETISTAFHNRNSGA